MKNAPQRKRRNQILLRATDEEYHNIKEKIKASGKSQNQFFLMAALEKEIVVKDGYAQIRTELKRIGNNLNQITKAVHLGKAYCGKELEELKAEVKKLWQL